MSSLSPNTLAPQPAPVVKISLYLFVNSHNPKKSCFSIYAGRTQVVTVPLTSRYKALIKEVVLRLRRQGPERDTKPNKSVEDEAPSFTTYHLQ